MQRYTGSGGGGSWDAEQTRDAIAAALVAGANVTITPNDGSDTITIAATGASYTAENARDDIATALVAGANITITPDDAANTITISAGPDATPSASRIFNVIQEFFHDAGSIATTQTNAGIFNAASFKAVLTTAESSYLVSHHDTFWYFCIPFDRVNASNVESDYPQSRDNSYAATMAGLVNSYGFDSMYLFGLAEWDNDPGNAVWATDRFQEAGATDASRYDLPTGLTRLQAYNQFMHFYGAANHDGNTDHHQLTTLLGQTPEQRGYKISANQAFVAHAFYGFELGLNSVCAQVQNDDISGIIGRIPFTRGAAHQYSGEWGIDMSHSRTYHTNGFGSTTYSSGTLVTGWSANNTKKHLYMAWGAGARQVLSEAFDHNQGPASGQTYNPTGLVYQAFNDFTQTRHPAAQRPPAHVPLAFIKDHISALEPQYGQFNQGRAVWYFQFSANAGENLCFNLINTAYPNNSTWGTNTTTGEPIGGTKWGEQFDFVTDRVAEAKLKAYDVAFLATNDAAGVNIPLGTLEGFVRDGGVLVLNAKQLTGTAHQTLTGITVGSGTTASSPTVTWVSDASTTAESGTVPYSNVTLGMATVFARIGTTPFIVKNNYGAGEVYTLLGDWGSNNSNNALLASTIKLIDTLVARFTKCVVTSPSHADFYYSVCRDENLTLVTIVNTSTSATSWTGTLTFRDIPRNSYTLTEWVTDTSVTNSLSASKVSASVTVPGNEARVFAFSH